MTRGIETAFSGRLGQSPNLKIAKSGKQWLSLSVAVGKGDDTQLVRVAVFGDRALELAETLQKGDNVYCEGRLTLNVWNAKGETRAGLSVATWKCEPVGQIGRRRPKKNSKQERQAENRDHVPRDWQAPDKRSVDLNDAIPF